MQTKETYMQTKVTNMLTKETYMLTKETYTHRKETVHDAYGIQDMMRTGQEKRPTHRPKRPKC